MEREIVATESKEEIPKVAEQNKYKSLGKRLLKEYSRIPKDASPGIQIKIREDNYRHLDVIIVGIEDTPYENGLFHLEIFVPKGYPMKPPKCHFLTKIFHPNIDQFGRICADILQDKWTPACTIADTCRCIQCLFSCTHDLDENVFNKKAAQLYNENRKQFEKRAKEWTIKYANGYVTNQVEVAIEDRNSSDRNSPVLPPKSKSQPISISEEATPSNKEQEFKEIHDNKEGEEKEENQENGTSTNIISIFTKQRHKELQLMSAAELNEECTRCGFSAKFASILIESLQLNQPQANRGENDGELSDLDLSGIVDMVIVSDNQVDALLDNENNGAVTCPMHGSHGSKSNGNPGNSHSSNGGGNHSYLGGFGNGSNSGDGYSGNNRGDRNGDDERKDEDKGSYSYQLSSNSPKAACNRPECIKNAETVAKYHKLLPKNMASKANILYTASYDPPKEFRAKGIVDISGNIINKVIPKTIEGAHIKNIYDYLDKSAAMQCNTQNDKNVVILNFDLHEEKSEEPIYFKIEKINKSKRDYKWSMKGKVLKKRDIESKYGIPPSPRSNSSFVSQLNAKKRVTQLLTGDPHKLYPSKFKANIFNKELKKDKSQRIILSVNKATFAEKLRTNHDNEEQKDERNHGLIEILMFNDTKYWIEFIKIIEIDQNDFGISFKYDPKADKISMTGIHLDKQRILQNHQLVLPQHKCHCLDDFNNNITDLIIGNVIKGNEIKTLQSETQQLKDRVKSFIDSIDTASLSPNTSPSSLWSAPNATTSTISSPNSITSNTSSSYSATSSWSGSNTSNANSVSQGTNYVISQSMPNHMLYPQQIPNQGPYYPVPITNYQQSKIVLFPPHPSTFNLQSRNGVVYNYNSNKKKNKKPTGQ